LLKLAALKTSVEDSFSVQFVSKTLTSSNIIRNMITSILALQFSMHYWVLNFEGNEKS